jgi:hypothetical protein
MLIDVALVVDHDSVAVSPEVMEAGDTDNVAVGSGGGGGGAVTVTVAVAVAEPVAFVAVMV